MGYLYIIQAGKENYYKIGISTAHPSIRRIKEIQTGNHLELSLVDTWETNTFIHAEKLMHLALSPYKSMGEWFNVEYDIIAYKLNAIKQLLAGLENTNLHEWSLDTDEETQILRLSKPFTCKYCGESKASMNAVYGHFRSCSLKKEHDSKPLTQACNCRLCSKESSG